MGGSETKGGWKERNWRRWREFQSHFHFNFLLKSWDVFEVTLTLCISSFSTTTWVDLVASAKGFGFCFLYVSLDDSREHLRKVMSNTLDAFIAVRWRISSGARLIFFIVCLFRYIPTPKCIKILALSCAQQDAPPYLQYISLWWEKHWRSSSYLLSCYWFVLLALFLPFFLQSCVLCGNWHPFFKGNFWHFLLVGVPWLRRLKWMLKQGRWVVTSKNFHSFWFFSKRRKLFYPIDCLKWVEKAVDCVMKDAQLDTKKDKKKIEFSKPFNLISLEYNSEVFIELTRKKYRKK